MPTKYATAAIAVALLTLAFAAPELHAANVSLLVTETGIPSRGASGRMAAAWEDGILDTFFEAGHIVSGAPSIRLADSRPEDGLPPEVEERRIEAELGGMEYFLLAAVDYGSGEVSLRLFATGLNGSAGPIAQSLHPIGPSANGGEGIKRAALGIAAFIR